MFGMGTRLEVTFQRAGALLLYSGSRHKRGKVSSFCFLTRQSSLALSSAFFFFFFLLTDYAEMGPVAQAKPSHPIFNSELITPKTLNTQSLITLHAKRPESEVRLWRTPIDSVPRHSQSGTLYLHRQKFPSSHLIGSWQNFLFRVKLLTKEGKMMATAVLLRVYVSYILGNSFRARLAMSDTGKLVFSLKPAARHTSKITVNNGGSAFLIEDWRYTSCSRDTRHVAEL